MPFFPCICLMIVILGETVLPRCAGLSRTPLTLGPWLPASQRTNSKLHNMFAPFSFSLSSFLDSALFKRVTSASQLGGYVHCLKERESGKASDST